MIEINIKKNMLFLRLHITDSHHVQTWLIKYKFIIVVTQQTDAVTYKKKDVEPQITLKIYDH